PRHGTKPMSGQRCFPDMARNRCRARGVSPTWHKNDVGAEVFPRHGVKPMSGQWRFPDMAQNRCRASSVSPTWHKTDVGAEVSPRRGIKTMSGQRLKPPTNTKPPEILMISGGSLSILYMLFFNYCFRLLNFLNSLTSHFAPYPKSGQQYRNRNTEVTKDRVEEVHKVYESDKAQEVPGNHTDYECDFIFSAVRRPEPGQERIQHADCRVIDDQQHNDCQRECQQWMDFSGEYQRRQLGCGCHVDL